jgi:hypothetical protein
MEESSEQGKPSDPPIVERVIELNLTKPGASHDRV